MGFHWLDDEIWVLKKRKSRRIIYPLIEQSPNFSDVARSLKKYCLLEDINK